MEETKERDFTRYVKFGKNYEPIGETRDVLPAGFYYPYFDSYHNKAYFTQKELVMPKLYVLPNEIQTEILDDIKKFWESEARYKQFGNVYKRNILLYSLPGNGKTSLINILCHKLIDEYDGVVIFIDNPSALSAYHVCMERFRDIEPNRKVITIIEDFERLAKDDHYTAMLLQLLDGNTQFDNVVTIATTNYPQILEKRFTCRPSRFNLVIEYKKPNDEVRRAYMTMKLKDAGIDVESTKVKNDIERLVGKTEGYTFDFVKEVIQGIYVDEIDESLLFERLNEIIKRNGRVVVSEEESKKIGFSLVEEKSCHGQESYVNETGAEYIEEDEADLPNDDWAKEPSRDVKIRGFVPYEIRNTFVSNNDVPGSNPVVEDLDPILDEPTIDYTNKAITKELLEEDKEND
jgi:SpoVK/Ycf46/Vps4 family AAA+-type ATPase